MDLVTSDRIFDRDSDMAYAQAWALTFYLVETQPHRYAKYLKLVAAHGPSETYASAARVADFNAAFGDSFPMLEARFKRYLDKIKSP